jgi:hypothetical protein
MTKKDADIAAKDKRIFELEHPGQVAEQQVVKLDCAITEVKRGDGFSLVALDKGGKAGLKIDMKLFVWNSTEGYKGKITIVQVQDDASFARIDWEEEGKQIKAGDTASVQNF